MPLIIPRNKLRLRTPQSSSIVGITPNATAHTKASGAFTELLSSLTNQCSVLKVYVQGASAFPSGTVTTWLVDIGIGAANSETVLIPNLMLRVVNTGGAMNAFTFQIPCRIAAGTRISARCQSDVASGSAISIAVTAYSANPTQVPAVTGVDALGVTSSGATSGTTVTPGSSGVKSSYVQLIASTTRPYIGLVGLIGQQVTGSSFDNLRVDIATGAASSEVDIIPNHCGVSYDTYMRGEVIPYTPVYIAASTRLSCRMASDGTGVAKSIALYGVY